MVRSYLIAITPPAVICDFVDAYIQKYSESTGYQIPPHITLCQSFYPNGVFENDIVQSIQKAVKNQITKIIYINKIAFFQDNNNVLYFKPDDATQEFTKGLFLKISKALSGSIKNRYVDFIVTPENFSAHITIAQKIPPDIFESIKKEAEAFNQTISFVASAVDIYRQEPNSKEYKLFRSISF